MIEKWMNLYCNKDILSSNKMVQFIDVRINYFVSRRLSSDQTWVRLEIQIFLVTQRAKIFDLFWKPMENQILYMARIYLISILMDSYVPFFSSWFLDLYESQKYEIYQKIRHFCQFFENRPIIIKYNNFNSTMRVIY